MDATTALDDLIAANWRTEPFVLHDGVRLLIEERRTYGWFDGVWKAAISSGKADVKERPDVSFVERASEVDLGLADVARHFQQRLHLPGSWCDAIRTNGSTGIGAHFDHSDNFVLQQQGSKRWRLSSVDHLPPDQVTARLRGDQGVGAADVEDDAFEVNLGPGDILYIPLLWAHEGVGLTENSLSVSIVCPVVTVYSAVMAGVAAALKSTPSTHRPLPLGPTTTWSASRMAEVNSAVLRRLHDGDLSDGVLAEQRRRGFAAEK